VNQFTVFHASSKVIKVIQLRSKRWAGHVARMRNAYNILVANLKGRDQLEDLVVDDRISEWILGK
jgi:hypothetical protein